MNEEAGTSLGLNMTQKPPADFLELEELSIAELSEDLDNVDEDTILDKPSVELLSPSSAWSVLINISVLSHKSAQALKKCGHSLQILTYNNTNPSFCCQLCNYSDWEDISADKEIVEVVEIGNVTNEDKNGGSITFESSEDVNKKVIVGSVEAIKNDVIVLSNSDVEIDNDSSLLVENLVPGTSNIEKEAELGFEKKPGPVLLFDTRFDKLETKTERIEDDVALDLLYPDVKIKEDEDDTVGAVSKINVEDTAEEVAVLRIRPLSELQNQMSDLPSYNSEQFSNDLNPMINIPTYVLDDSIVDVEEPQTKTPTVSKKVYKVMNPSGPNHVARPLQFQQNQIYHPQQNYILNSFSQPEAPSNPSTSPRVSSLQSPQFQPQMLPSPNYVSYQTSPSQQHLYRSSPQRYPNAGYSPQNPYQNLQTYQRMKTPTRNSPSLIRAQGRVPFQSVGEPAPSPLRLSSKNQMSIDNLVMQKSQLYQDQTQFLSQNFSPQSQNMGQNHSSVQKSLYSRIQQFQTNSSQAQQQGVGEVQRQTHLPQRDSFQTPPRVQNQNPAFHALNSSSLSVNIIRSSPKQVIQDNIRQTADQDPYRSPLPLYHDPRLPQGWKRSVFRTEQGQFAVILMDPQGRKFRSKEEVRKYVEMKRVVGLDPESMDFSVFGKV